MTGSQAGRHSPVKEGTSMKRYRLAAIVFAFMVLAAACGGTESTETTAAGSEPTDTTATVDLNQGSDLTFHMVTHSDDGTFWSVVKKGMEDACTALGVNCVWSPSFNDPSKQVSDIEAAIAAGSDGIGVSLANPEAVVPAATDAVAAGIPVVTINSGVNDYQSIGAITHIGQTEIAAGNGAG
ncbi:MAG: substrate-binding domain-containing protein, partial [Acidimicrobiia bacterium]|nr:substrate-binding domain-containing protein [Acidimicrobiia bacterium]